MDALQELILREVAWRYPNDVSFYSKHGFNSGRWADFKAGRTEIGNMKYSRVNGMIRSLFSGFELELLKEAQFNKVSNWTKLSVLEEYDRLRLKAVKEMGDNLVASIGATIHGGNQANNLMHVNDARNKHIEMTFKNIGAPAGKKARREFILNNLDSL